MRVLVTGGTGLVGVPFVKRAVETGFKVYVGCHRNRPNIGEVVEVDLLDADKVEAAFRKVNPEAVLHLAAYTDVDGCEKNRDLALKINSEATGLLSRLAARHRSFLLYVSTDYVFDGRKGMYSEGDEPNPINWYGVTKLRGEELVKQHAWRWCIARISTPYGLHPSRKSFPIYVAERLMRGENVQAASDQYTSPTYTGNLADMLLEVLSSGVEGVLHLAGATRASRLQVAKLTASYLGLNSSLITPVEASTLKWVSKRPKDSSLNISRAANTLRSKPETLEEGLRHLAADLKPIGNRFRDELDHA